MLLSVNWLKDYVDIDVPVKEFADRMILSGSNIETVEEIGTGIEGVKLGRIDKIAKHPDADRLSVCEVAVGEDEPIQIITNAKNIKEGDYVPVAVHNSRIPAMTGEPPKEGGFKIKKTKMRGVSSYGMFCGSQEMGYSDKVAPYISKDGIWTLPGDWEDEVGSLFDEALELKDYIIDFEITPNRPDCLSMLGMAREAAATFGTKMRYPETGCDSTDEDTKDYIEVEVNSDLCKRYTARVIKDVRIEQSPWWLQKRLMAAGMRPINNIVDLTNFVMLEYGQPLHAFDIENLDGGRIVVDMAKDGEKFTTLDGAERELDHDMLMIKDGSKSVALAGIMGGLNSDVTETTKTVVLESACFSRASVRQTSKKLALRTEASGRFEKGIDANNCQAAADRFCRLIQELGYGKVLNGSVDVYKVPEEAETVTARVSRINKVLGTELSRAKMQGYLESLEMVVEGEGDKLVVTPPTVRMDLLEEVDFIEEVARMHGYGNLPSHLPKLATKPEFSKSWTMRDLSRRIFTGMGANEIQTYGFTNQKILDKAGVPCDSPKRHLVRIINPMGEDTEFMRTTLIPGMLDTMQVNLAKGTSELRAFEICDVFNRNPIDEDALPEEAKNITVGIIGRNEDFFVLKGMIEEYLKCLGVRGVSFCANSESGTFHPGRCAVISALDSDNVCVELGIMGEVHPDISDNYNISGRAYIAELSFDTLVEIAERQIQYSRPPMYPSTSRDVAMVVEEGLPVGEIESAVRGMDNELLEDIELFDIYRGDQVEEGRKSVAYRMIYRSPKKTLTDGEADKAHQSVLDLLKERFHADLRDS